MNFYKRSEPIWRSTHREPCTGWSARYCYGCTARGVDASRATFGFATFGGAGNDFWRVGLYGH